MKDLVEFARSKAAGCEFEYQDFNHIWTPLNYPSWNAVLLDEALEDGKIRIKPNKNYCRVYKDEFIKVADQDTPFLPFDDWRGFLCAELIKYFEIEQPVPDNETITLYEHTRPANDSQAFDVMWLTSPDYRLFDTQATGRTITAAIQGDKQ